MHPTITAIIAEERSEELVRRSSRAQSSRAPGGSSRSPRRRAIRRYFRRLSLAH